MESLIDVITTSFQAVLTVCVVFTAGYAYNGDRQQQVGTVSDPCPQEINLD